MTQASPIDVLYQALAEPIGLIIRVSDREQVRQRLYQARTKAGDKALEGLQIRVSAWAEGDLVVCHQKVLVKAAEQEKK